MKTVRRGTPSEVAAYDLGGRPYTERELRDLAAAGRVRAEGGDGGEPLRVGYVWSDEDGAPRYDLAWVPEPPTRVSPAEDDPREWPVEPPPPLRRSGGGGNDPDAGPPEV